MHLNFGLDSKVSDLQRVRREEPFVLYRTSTYSLHLFETLSGLKFIALSDAKSESLRFLLRQLYAGPYVQHVVRNPWIKLDSKDRKRGIDNDAFRQAVDQLIGSTSA